MLFKNQINNCKVVRDSDYKIYVWEGSVRSGKTTNISACVPLMMKKCPKEKLAIVGVSQATIERNVVRSLKEVFGDSQVNYVKSHQRLYMGGRTFDCIGATDDRAEAKIKGSTLAGVVVDEVTELPESVFRCLVQRVSLPGSTILVSTNPDGPQHWFKKDYLDRAEEIGLKSFRMLMDDNESLEESYKRTVKASHTGVWYKRFILGEWAKAAGLVFPDFNEECVIDDNRPVSPKFYVSVDFGTTNPCVFLLIGVDHQSWPRVWVEDERYFDSKKEGYHKTELDHVRECIEFCALRGVRDVFVDPAAISFITSLRIEGKGLTVRAANNAVLPGIMKLDTMLSTGDLKINARCKNLINEMNMYAWDTTKTESGKDVPKKEFDHAVDALRYFVFSCSDIVTRDAPETNYLYERSFKQERQISANKKMIWANPMKVF